MAHEFRAFTLDTPATGYLERFFQARVDIE